jgi:hypothetical protein
MNEKKTPELPAVPELTQEKLNVLLAADWLESLATLIRKGTVTSFQLAWDTRYGKPVGPILIESNLLRSPLELKLLSQLAEQDAKIPYKDLTEDLKDHDCDDKNCPVCNPLYEA